VLGCCGPMLTVIVSVRSSVVAISFQLSALRPRSPFVRTGWNRRPRSRSFAIGPWQLSLIKSLAPPAYRRRE
jgi:hypothetical protein